MNAGEIGIAGKRQVEVEVVEVKVQVEVEVKVQVEVEVNIKSNVRVKGNLISLIPVIESSRSTCHKSQPRNRRSSNWSA